MVKNNPGDKKTDIARVIAITSGDKEVGKTSIAVSFAIVLANLGNRVTLLDMNPSSTGVNMLMNIEPEHNLGHILNEGKSLDSVITRTPYSVGVIHGMSRDDSLTDLSEQQKENLSKAMGELCHSNDYIIIDTKAGESHAATILTKAADEVIVVTTTKPDAVVDAYAAIKLIKQNTPDMITHLIINKAESEKAATATMNRLEKIAEQFMHGHLEDDGFIPLDNSVMKAEAHHQPFVIYDPAGVASQALTGITNIIINRHTSPISYVKGQQDGFFVRLKRDL